MNLFYERISISLYAVSKQPEFTFYLANAMPSFNRLSFQTLTNLAFLYLMHTAHSVCNCVAFSNILIAQKLLHQTTVADYTLKMNAVLQIVDGFMTEGECNGINDKWCFKAK